MRSYQHPADYQPVSDFLIRHHKPGNTDGNWLQPTWEYMHSHPNLDETALEQFGIWEESGEIIGVVHYESTLGEVFFQRHPEHKDLITAMLDYAEVSLGGVTREGLRFVDLYINDFDTEFKRLVRSRSYQRNPDHDRPLSQFAIPDPFPKISLPDGFKLKSLQEDNDLRKIHRVLWRGFNHPGEPPPEGIEWRRKMQSGPNFRKDLNIVIESPGGDFVSYSGTWYEGTNRYAYVEPVATDPDYRRMGLGKAAVLEGIRRCGELGANVAYVGSDLPFYKAFGFKEVYNSQCWRKYIDDPSEI